MVSLGHAPYRWEQVPGSATVHRPAPQLLRSWPRMSAGFCEVSTIPLHVKRQLPLPQQPSLPRAQACYLYLDPGQGIGQGAGKVAMAI